MATRTYTLAPGERLRIDFTDIWTLRSIIDDGAAAVLMDPRGRIITLLRFHKADAERALTVWQLDLPQMGPAALRHTLIEQGLATRLVEYLLSCCGADCDSMLPHAVLATLLSESWFGMLDTLTAEGANIMPHPDTPSHAGRDDR